MDFQNLGDWCKWLEKNFSNEVMIPTLPVIIRLDGNNFHNWTRGLERPFDKKLTELMKHGYFREYSTRGILTATKKYNKGVLVDLEVKLKRGTYVKRIKTSKPFTADELKDLPPIHQSHKNPNLVIKRSFIKEIEYPIFSKIGNKEDVIFYDAEPILNVL
jgi:hypothetical protein